jgi:hypothetical protein
MIAVVLPPTVLVTIGDTATEMLGSGAFADKVETHVGYAEELASEGYEERGSGGGPWFLRWFTTPIFWSLIITGHFLFAKMAKKKDDPLYQLWVLIILMWAMQFAMWGYAEGWPRVQRNTTALLLLWHARWFLVRKEGAGIAVLLNALPMLFYFVVYYRRWLQQAGVGAFLPVPFGIWSDLWTTVMAFLGFG